MLTRKSTWLILIVISLNICLHCSTTFAQLDTRTGDNPTMQTTTTDQTMADRARQTYDALMQHYYVTELNLYRGHNEVQDDGLAFAELWPYSGVVSALNALAAMPEGGEAYHDDLRRVLDGLQQYYDPYGIHPGYDSYVREFGGGQKYYDDNEWLGLDFITAYHTLGDPVYLERAKITFDFAVSGWSETDGGIYWRENDLSTRNTCSNGPAAVLALRLYQETNDEAYLNWAIKILDWLKVLKAPSGVYWDNIASNGTIDFRTYTYNTGTVIHANALLYEITGEEAYLNEARAVAEATLNHFSRDVTGTEVGIYPATPWFNAVLYKGYLALYAADPDHDPRYIQSFHDNLNYAWEHARGSLGFFNPDWAANSNISRGSDGNNTHYWLLDQAAMIELYALLSHPLPE